MFWNRWAGKIALAIVVLAVAVWATHQKLLSLAPLEFWSLVIGYLAVTEGVWLVWEQKAADAEKLRRRGLVRLPKATTLGVKAGEWFFGGCRPRLTDIWGRMDAPREYVTGLMTSLVATDSTPRLHVIYGAHGTGRSTLLMRLGQILAERNHDVIRLLPTASGGTIETLSREISRKRTLYLLVDDIDLMPLGADLLYAVFRSGGRVVVVATAQTPELADHEEGPMAALDPANLMARGIHHEIQVTAHDLSALIGKLRALGRLNRPEVAGENAETYLAALRHLQAESPSAIWEWRAVRDLPEAGRIAVAMAGVAEMGLPINLLADLGAPAKLSTWLKSGLVVVENDLCLPPHREQCLTYLSNLGYNDPRLTTTLSAMVKHALQSMPTLVPRLLYGLGQTPELRNLVTTEALAHRDQLTGSGIPSDIQRQWREVWGLLELEIEANWLEEDYAPTRCLLARSMMLRQQFEASLTIYRALETDPVYRELACYNAALVLMHLGRYDEADEELGKLRQPLAGVHFLRGLIAEKRGDMMVALDHYESSRKAFELELQATQRLAFTYLRTGAPRAAIPLFESLLARMPCRAELYGGLAVAHLHSGNSQRAVAQSARAIQAGVDPARARKAVAHAFREANAYDRMVTELEAVVSYTPNDREAWDDLAMGCHWMGRYQREEQCLTQIRRCEGTDRAPTMLRLARCLRDQGRSTEALETLLPLVAAAEPAVEVLLLTAEVAGSCGQRDVQYQMAQRALEAGDTSGWGHFWLADSSMLEAEAQREAYRRAIQSLEARHAHGMPHRVAASLWHAVWVAATRIGDESSAERALHHARQDASICKAIASEIESVTARRSVPPDIFLAELPDPQLPPAGGIPQSPPGPAALPEAPVVRPVFTPTRASGRGTLRL